MEIKEISYKDEPLEFFADQQRILQRRYDKLAKTIKPDEPYLSERRQLLDDCGRELSFYNDVIEMLENDVAPKRQMEMLQEVIFKKEDLMQQIAEERNKYSDELEVLKDKIEKLEVYIDDLNDSKENLVVMLSEAEDEVERLQAECDRLKRDNEYILMQHAFQRRPSGDCWNDVIEKRKSEAIQEVLEKLDRFINSQCIEIKDERGIKGYITSGVHYAIDEFKRKHAAE